MFTNSAQQADAGYIPQQTSSAVQNDLGYDNVTNPMNNDPYYYSQHNGHYVDQYYPYANNGLFNSYYQGQQQKRPQNNGQDVSFLNKYGGQNSSFKHNGKPGTPFPNHHINHGNYQHAHQFAVPRQMNDHQYTYQQYPPSNQVSSYPGQGSYMPTGKNSCYTLCYIS